MIPRMYQRSQGDQVFRSRDNDFSRNLALFISAFYELKLSISFPIENTLSGEIHGLFLSSIAPKSHSKVIDHRRRFSHESKFDTQTAISCRRDMQIKQSLVTQYTDTYILKTSEWKIYILFQTPTSIFSCQSKTFSNTSTCQSKLSCFNLKKITNNSKILSYIHQ